MREVRGHEEHVSLEFVGGGLDHVVEFEEIVERQHVGEAVRVLPVHEARVRNEVGVCGLLF